MGYKANVAFKKTYTHGLKKISLTAQIRAIIALCIKIIISSISFSLPHDVHSQSHKSQIAASQRDILSKY